VCLHMDRQTHEQGDSYMNTKKKTLVCKDYNNFREKTHDKAN